MSLQTASSPRVSVEDVSRFLFEEAALLDNNQLAAWLQVLTPDVDYRVPVRIGRERTGGSGFSEQAFYLREDFGTLSTRIMRLDSEFAWSESPPTRTRRCISNVRLGESSESERGHEVLVFNNLVVFCHRGDVAAPVILSGERQDTLRWVDGTWRLARRLVLLDSTVLGLQALSIFL